MPIKHSSVLFLKKSQNIEIGLGKSVLVWMQLKPSRMRGHSPWAHRCSSETGPGEPWWRFPGPCLRWCYLGSLRSGKGRWVGGSPSAPRRCRPREPPHRESGAEPANKQAQRWKKTHRHAWSLPTISSSLNMDTDVWIINESRSSKLVKRVRKKGLCIGALTAPLLVWSFTLIRFGH